MFAAHIEQLSFERVNADDVAVVAGKPRDNPRHGTQSLTQDECAFGGIRCPAQIRVDEIRNTANGLRLGPVGFLSELIVFGFCERTCDIHDPHLGDLFNEPVANRTGGPEFRRRRIHEILCLTIE